MKKAARQGIHTCLDTSGITFQPEDSGAVRSMDRLMDVTRLVMLDIKHIDPEAHQKLCGHSNRRILDFARYLAERNVPVWIRHVVVPGITDREEDLYRLGRFIGTLGNVQGAGRAALPRHGQGQYRKLGIDYPLKDVKPSGAGKSRGSQAGDSSRNPGRTAGKGGGTLLLI